MRKFILIYLLFSISMLSFTQEQRQNDDTKDAKRKSRLDNRGDQQLHPLPDAKQSGQGNPPESIYNPQTLGAKPTPSPTPAPSPALAPKPTAKPTPTPKSATNNPWSRPDDMRTLQLSQLV